jgi:LacI family transcriptional regulator
MCHSSSRERPMRWETQQTALVKWLKQLPQPIGILACTDQLGFWLLDACARAGLRVPDQVAVLGVENDETLCAMSHPPLSSVRLGGERVGFEAARLLDRMMRGAKPRKTPLLLPPLGIESRQSTDAIAAEDPVLAHAIHRVRTDAVAGLRVDDLLESIPISRSSLERGFRRVLGRSPHAEINRVRLQKAADLLTLTELSLDVISLRTGFADKHYFSKCFRDAFGVPPGQYRRSVR